MDESEKFALILPDTKLYGATHIARAVRRSAEQPAILHQDSPVATNVTISGGVSVLTNISVQTELYFIRDADQAFVSGKTPGPK